MISSINESTMRATAASVECQRGWNVVKAAAGRRGNFGERN